MDPLLDTGLEGLFDRLTLDKPGLEPHDTRNASSSKVQASPKSQNLAQSDNIKPPNLSVSSPSDPAKPLAKVEPPRTETGGHSGVSRDTSTGFKQNRPSFTNESPSSISAQRHHPISSLNAEDDTKSSALPALCLLSKTTVHHPVSYRDHLFQDPSLLAQRRRAAPEEDFFSVIDGMDAFMPTSPGSLRSESIFHDTLSSSLASQEYTDNIATRIGANGFSFGSSFSRIATSPMHEHFAGINARDQDPFSYVKMNDDALIQLISPGEINPKLSNWTIDRSQPMCIPTGEAHGHGRTSSTGSYNRPHPYSRTDSFSTNSEFLSPVSPTSPSLADQGPTVFHQHQQAAAQAVYKYMQAHPRAAIPASFITPDLAEVIEGRRWCLIGNCGIERAAQRANPLYDSSKDASKKRLDHLYDHIRDKHFNNRPFQCTLAPASCQLSFSREHDLKRHEMTHQAVSLPCPFCDKVYTRNDNLKRHVQLKHSGISMETSLPQMNRMTPASSYRYGFT